MDANEVNYEVLTARDIHDLEPNLATIYKRGIFQRDSLWISSPQRVVLGMVELLKSNQPLGGDGSGTAFIYRDGIESAMETEASARHLTLALAGRAKNVAPALADTVRPGDGTPGSGGRLLASGIFIDREPEVRRAFAAVGLRVVRREQETEWVSLDLERPGL